MLESSANAIDVVEQVVRLLEDNPIFNAGRGCVLNDQGEHELDASIMDGSNLRCGAVGSIRKAKHPVSVARKVMTDTKHILLIGEGADQFAIAAQCELAEADYFRTERQKSNWEMWKKKESSTSLYRPQMLPANDDEPLYLGTVGCVVVDRSGNLAAATSTGGLMGKRWGRVGDSPIIGAGNYADNATCAVSGTGVGEEFIRHTIASDVAARMRYADQSLQDATRAAVSQLPADCGGVIAVDAAGEIAIEFNTPGMSRAYANSAGVHAVKLGREE
jgi:beta-aspartyl-peptidase (threonine type)